MHQNALQYRLRALNYLDKEDFAALDEPLKHREDASPGELIVMEDQDMNRTWVLLDGWAFRFKSFPDGRRQILNYMLPGDIMGLYAAMLKRSECGVEAITPLTLAVFPSTELIDALVHRPRLLLALSWIAGQSERLLDEQIARVGRRGAHGAPVPRVVRPGPVRTWLRSRRGGWCCSSPGFWPGTPVSTQAISKKPRCPGKPAGCSGADAGRAGRKRYRVAAFRLSNVKAVPPPRRQTDDHRHAGCRLRSGIAIDSMS